MLAVDGGEDRVGPTLGADASGWAGSSRSNQPASVHFERVKLQLPSTARQKNSSEYRGIRDVAESHAVEHADESHGFDLEARLFEDLFHDDLGRGVADVAPTRRIEPEARVGALDQEQFALLVGDRRADGDFGRLRSPGTPRPTSRIHSLT